MTNVIVAGGRDFNNYELLKNNLDIILSEYTNVQIVSGNARGADKLGEQYAKENSIDLIIKPAEWNLYGKSAGYIRNEEMSQISNVCVCFWDGKSKGTKNMIEIAKKKNLKLYIIKY